MKKVILGAGNLNYEDWISMNGKLGMVSIILDAIK